MKFLVEISDKEVGIGSSERFDKPYQLRKAARAVLFDDEGKLAFQKVSKFNYHKLPGGGIDDDETIKNALQREILEEVGCKSDIGEEVGVIIEYRNELDILQISYCYLAKVVGEVGEPTYEQEEIDEGHEPLWTSLDEAIELLRSDSTEDYEGKFIVIRDLAFLEEAKRMLNSQ